jgi:2-methylcitrate dehydratase PrpD
MSANGEGKKIMSQPARREQILEDAVARFVVGLKLGALTPQVVQAARRLMQDQLAVQIGCSRLPWSQAILGFVRAQHVPGKSRVTSTRDRMSSPDAAFLNATFGHGFEYDDAHRASSSHPGSCIVSAALAMGDELGSTMGEVLLGMVAGYEVYTRIGILAAPELLERGYHPHAILSNFGAAAVVAKMRSFDLDMTTHALAIAMSHCSGTTEYTSSGGSVKRVHAGIGTRNGMNAAEMAHAGITGPSTFLTGRKGLFRTFLQKNVGADGVAAFALDLPFEIEKIWIKPYCCCGCNHAYIDGARQLSSRVAEIDSIELGIQAGADVVVGNRNVNAFAPKIIEHLQYSLPVQVALALLGRGNGFRVHEDYMQGRLDLSQESDVLHLARRIRIVREQEFDAAYPGKWVGELRVAFRNGSSQRLFIEDPIGTAENPISQEDLDAKFRDLTVKSIGATRSEQLLETINSFGLQTRSSDFTALLAA